MSSQNFPIPITPEHYLKTERKALLRSEYLSNQVFVMTGATRAHGEIVANVTREIGVLLRGTQYRPSVGVCVVAPASYLIPDIVVYRDGAKFTGENDLLENPTVIIEVHSNSTSAFDHGPKWNLYQQIRSLMHYVMISQYEPHVELYSSLIEGGWRYESVVGLDQMIDLPAIGCKLNIADIYEGVGIG